MTSRETSDRVRPSVVSLLAEIYEKNKTVSLAMDNFHTNKLPFFMKLSQILIFNTVQYLIDIKKHNILEAITLICQLYHKRGW